MPQSQNHAHEILFFFFARWRYVAIVQIGAYLPPDGVFLQSVGLLAETTQGHGARFTSQKTGEGLRSVRGKSLDLQCELRFARVADAVRITQQTYN